MRPGFHEKLEKICRASAEKIDTAMRSLEGGAASIKDVLRIPDVDEDVKTAMVELMVFTTEVVGSDGARAKLRHEQNGYALMFGQSGGFLTPNLADVRSPLMVVLHGAGGDEQYNIDLLDEEPVMPNARAMLRIVADDPVAQARFFIISMRLFCEHVLGTGPFDSWLRHNGHIGADAEGAAFPDGYAASGLGGAFGMLAALHGPIEEQARLSIHPHILLWFLSSLCKAWLRSVLRRETTAARDALRVWQEKVLAFVQSTQIDSAAILPLLLHEDPTEAEPPRNTPFTEKHQKDCRMDGQLENDAKNPEKRRPLLATQELFQDHHVRRSREGQSGSSAVVVPSYLVPLTGAQLSILPHYRLFRFMTTDDRESLEGRQREAAAWREAYTQDYRQNIAVGQMHEHKDTCFKYVVNKTMRMARHCRFHFCHFVRLFLWWGDAAAGSKPKRMREVTLARTGKELVLPRLPGEAAPNLCPVDATGELVPLRPTNRLGPTVVCDQDHGKDGCVLPVRWNPLEGSSNGPCQVCLRGNVDYQNMARVTHDGFNSDPNYKDRLRQTSLTKAEIEQERQNTQRLESERFEVDLPRKVKLVQMERRRKRLEVKEPELIEEDLRNAWELRKAKTTKTDEKCGFRRWAHALTSEAMRASIQAMFYACDYSTKPNITCAPMLVAIRDGIQRLEEQLRTEDEKAQSEELVRQSLQATPAFPFESTSSCKRKLSKLEDEARRRLIRQAQAANQAIVKGNCLMAMQMLTGREVLRTHFPWQLMMKHSMWMALQHRREMQGFDEQEVPLEPILQAAEAVSSDEASCCNASVKCFI